MHVIEEIEQVHAAELQQARPIATFTPGDTVRVNVRVREGGKERIQGYEGVVIGRSGRGLNENFVVRKISYGEGVERVFPVHSPMIESIEVKRRGRVRRAKLYYLRGRRGKSARIPERKDHRAFAGKKKSKASTSATAFGTPESTETLFVRPDGAPDDLTQISGVGDVLVERLNALGITRFAQIADFSDADIAQVDERLNFKGRITREDWIGQTKLLMAGGAKP